MRAVAKHFPGHGGVPGDTHVEQPVDRRAYADLQMADLRPFEWLIGNGIAAVMMSHVVYPAVAEEPASLSRVWIQDILRNRLGFQGVVFADDLSMRGAATGGDMLARVAMALEAGCDFTPICNDREAVAAVIDGSGQLPEEPASGLRRARMEPTEHLDRRALRQDPRWRAARESLARQAADPGFELEG